MVAIRLNIRGKVILASLGRIIGYVERIFVGVGNFRIAAREDLPFLNCPDVMVLQVGSYNVAWFLAVAGVINLVYRIPGNFSARISGENTVQHGTKAVAGHKWRASQAPAGIVKAPNGVRHFYVFKIIDIRNAIFTFQLGFGGQQLRKFAAQAYYRWYFGLHKRQLISPFG